MEIISILLQNLRIWCLRFLKVTISHSSKLFLWHLMNSDSFLHVSIPAVYQIRFAPLCKSFALVSIVGRCCFWTLWSNLDVVTQLPPWFKNNTGIVYSIEKHIWKSNSHEGTCNIEIPVSKIQMFFVTAAEEEVLPLIWMIFSCIVQSFLFVKWFVFFWNMHIIFYCSRIKVCNNNITGGQ